MRYCILLITVLFSIGLYAQIDTTPPFKRFPILPPFELLKADSSVFTRAQVEKKHKVMLMFFSPTCEHCKHQTEDFIKAMDSLKDIEIIMATYQPMEEMRQFYEKYHIAKYKNIVMGRDTKYFFPPYYRMRNMPYLALYNKKGNFITFFEGNHKVVDILDAFKE
jgi:thiol-disulfide isomerase/thioredoxin